MAEVFSDLLHSSMEILIDDIFGHAEIIEDWVHLLENILKRGSQFGLKLNANKCVLFDTEVKLCGRIFDANGMRHDPERIHALVNPPEPTTCQQLQQFLMATQWMIRSNPDYNKHAIELQNLYNRLMVNRPRTKYMGANVDLDTH